MIKVLVVEDSPTARELILAILGMDPELKVCGVVDNGLDAVQLTKELWPDVILMDIQMPKMDGFQATKLIMSEKPTPIVIVSGHRDVREVTVAIEALRAGALTALPKPRGIASPYFQKEADHLLTTVKAMAGVAVVRHRAAEPDKLPQSPALAALKSRVSRVELIVTAASTGGPAALHKVISALPADFEPPILIVQHLSAGFIAGLASSLGSAAKLPVKVAQASEPLAPRTVYLAPYGRHLVVRNRTTIGLLPKRDQDRFCPSANVLFESAAQVFGEATVGVMLTGMSNDGVDGCRAIRAAGGEIVAQDEATSLVFGMPKETISAGLADRILSISNIGPWLATLRTRKSG